MNRIKSSTLMSLSLRNCSLEDFWSSKARMPVRVRGSPYQSRELTKCTALEKRLRRALKSNPYDSYTKVKYRECVCSRDAEPEPVPEPVEPLGWGRNRSRNRNRLKITDSGSVLTLQLFHAHRFPWRGCSHLSRSSWPTLGRRWKMTLSKLSSSLRATSVFRP